MSSEKELQQSIKQFLASAKPWTLQEIKTTNSAIEVSLGYENGVLKCKNCRTNVSCTVPLTFIPRTSVGVIKRIGEPDLKLKTLAMVPVIECSCGECKEPNLPWMDEDTGVPMFGRKQLIPWNVNHDTLVQRISNSSWSQYAKSLGISKATLNRCKKDQKADPELIEKIEADLQVDLRIPFCSIDFALESFVEENFGAKTSGDAEKRRLKKFLAFVGVWRGRLRQTLSAEVPAKRLREEQMLFLDLAVDKCLKSGPSYLSRLVAFAETFSGQWQYDGTSNSESETSAAILSSLHALWDKYFGEGGRLQEYGKSAKSLICKLVDQAANPPKKRIPLALDEIEVDCGIPRKELKDIFEAKLQWIRLDTDMLGETVQLSDVVPPQNLLDWANGTIGESPTYVRDIYVNTKAIPTWSQWLKILQNEYWNDVQKQWMKNATSQFAKAFVEECGTIGIAELTPRLDILFSFSSKSFKGGYESDFFDAVRENVDATISKNQHWSKAGPSSGIKICLVGLTVGTTKFDEVTKQIASHLSDCYVYRIKPISKAISRHPKKDAFINTLTQLQVLKGKSNEAARLRSNAVLAQLLHKDELKNHMNEILQDLSEISGESLQEWLDLFSPIATGLAKAAQSLYKNPISTPIERQTAIDVRIEYTNELSELTKLLLVADADHFDRVFKKLWDKFSNFRDDLDTSLSKERVEAETQLSFSYETKGQWNQSIAEAKLGDRLESARRIANSVIAAEMISQKLSPKSETEFLLGKSGLSHRDPNVVSYIVHGLQPAGFDINRLNSTMFPKNGTVLRDFDSTLLQNALRVIAQFEPNSWVTEEHRSEVVTPLLKLRAHDACGVASTADWLIRMRFPNESYPQDPRQLNSAIRALETRSSEASWYSLPRIPTHSMAVMKADMAQLGSPESSKYHGIEPYRKAVINRTFALSVRHVTFSEFKQWIVNTEKIGEQYLANIDAELLRHYPIDSNSVLQPAFYVDFITAARFANWLSDEDQLTHAFKIVESKKGVKVQIVKGNPNGYRMPTSAEYEFAVRGNTITDRFFGDDVALLQQYSWINNWVEKPQPASMLPPSQNGIFDAYGNVYTWMMHDPMPGDTDYEDKIARGIVRGAVRAIRGSCILDPHRESRSSYEYEQATTHQKYFISFRLARTISSTNR